MAQTKMARAKEAKFDEFYTQYEDIQKEINAYLEYNPDVFRDKVVLCPCDDPEWSNFTRFFAQNFEMLGLKKLISTSYAIQSKEERARENGYQFCIEDYISNLEVTSDGYNKDISPLRGKIFTLTRKDSKKIDINDLEWKYLEGDGDFRSEEIRYLRDEADIIVTNPPFSLYIEFIKWIMETDKKFLVIANKLSGIYKEVFPLVRSNKIWTGKTEWSGGMWFETKSKTDIDEVRNGVNMKNVASAWFTNLEHGRRHQPLQLMTMADNLKYSRHKELREYGYIKYDNFDAIEVKYVDSIPSDYDGMMGVPPTFLEKYNPEQFEILGLGTGDFAKEIGIKPNYRGRTDLSITVDGKQSCPASRIIIRKRV